MTPRLTTASHAPAPAPAPAPAALAVARTPDAVAIGRAVEVIMPGGTRAELRAAVLVAFGIFLLGDGGPPSPTVCGVPALTFVTGLAEADVRAGASALVHAGVLATAAGPLAPGDVSDSPDRLAELLAKVPVLLDPAFLREAPAARLVDWVRVREAAAGSPMALAATRALFDALPQPAHWTPVTLRALTAAMRYSTSVAVTAVRRAVERGIVDERPQPGGASAFRFAPAMLHGGRVAPPALPAGASLASGAVLPAARRPRRSSAGPVSDSAPPSGAPPAPGTAGTRMRVLRQGEMVLARVPEGVPITFVQRADGGLIPQIGGDVNEAPFTIDVE